MDIWQLAYLNKQRRQAQGVPPLPATDPLLQPRALERVLEARGWLRRIAGETDFALAANAARKALALGRGLLLTGAAGVGKTHLLKALAALPPFSGNLIRLPFEIATFDPHLDESIANYLLAQNLLIDDLGTEPTHNNFGLLCQHTGEFIIRYTTEGQGRLLITTNLTPQAISTRYGDRIAQRIFERTVVTRLSGHTKRQFIISNH